MVRTGARAEDVPMDGQSHQPQATIAVARLGSGRWSYVVATPDGGSVVGTSATEALARDHGAAAAARLAALRTPHV